MVAKYDKFLSARSNLIESSPIRVAVAKIAELRNKGLKVISLAAGDPDPDVIPRKLLADLMKDILADPRSVIYAPTQGWPDTRDAISKYYKEQFGLDVDMDNILVTTGGEQTLDIVPRVLCDPGDVVILENPSYTNTILCWRHYAVQMYGVPIDDNGMKIDVLESLLRKLRSEGKIVKLVYIITPGHNPTGVTLNMDRCKHLLELASKYDFLIFEDAAYLPLQYDGNIKPLLSMDYEDRVLHTSAASKVIGTGWRVGWLIAKDMIFNKCLQAKMPIDMCAPSPSQLLFATLIEKKYIMDIIEKARRSYRKKRDIMIKSIEEYLKGVRFTRPIAGMFIMLWLKEKIDGWDLFNKLADKQQVIIVPGAPFFLDNSGNNTIRLNFSRPSIEEIPVAVERISRVLKEEYGF